MFKNLFVNKNGSVVVQFLRYCISGGLAFAVDFSVLYLTTTIAGWHYLIGTACGYVLGLVITYLLSIAWVFDKRKMTNRWIEFLGFTLIGAVGIGLTQLFMWLFTDLLFQDETMYLYSKLITVVIVSGVNFVLKKIFLFSNKKPDGKTTL